MAAPRVLGTVLVTGASSGLGERFALAAAARGSPVVLVARRADRLDALARRIADMHGVGTDTIACDLAAPGIVPKLMQELAARGRTIDTLINNAGFGALGAVAETQADVLTRMIDLNCRTLAELCRAVLPGMLARDSGGILNVASVAAFQPGPYMTVYYATKAFVLHFSEGLHEEVRARGVHVSALCPGPTRTEFADVAGLNDSVLFSRFVADADAVVAAGMAALDANQAVAVPGAGNKLMTLGARLLPRGTLRRIAGGMQKRRH